MHYSLATIQQPFKVGCNVYLGWTSSTPCISRGSLAVLPNCAFFTFENGTQLTHAVLVTHAQAALLQAELSITTMMWPD
jgi:hypothetical protein